MAAVPSATPSLKQRWLPALWKLVCLFVFPKQKELAMNKISVGKTFSVNKFPNPKKLFVLVRNYSKETDKDKAEGKESDEKFEGPKGGNRDKLQSIKEESFFHKQDREQMKALKDRIVNKEKDKGEK